MLQGVGHVEGVIYRANGAGGCRVAGQADWLARRTQANGNFRAEGAQLKQGAQLLGAQARMLVASVETYRVANQALADADGDARRIGRSHGLSPVQLESLLYKDKTDLVIFV